MIPWELIDTARVPGGAEALRLMRRGDEFSIMLGNNALMNSRLSGSEKALATLAYEKVHARPAPRLLIGGLGMGFTLRAVLAVAAPAARIVVAELVPAVVGWARGPMAQLHGASLTDRRVTIEEVDVSRLISRANASFDAILLDVDNGPEGLTRESNDRLYSMNGLIAARRALQPGGVLAVWSSGPDQRFTQRLRSAGFVVEEAKARAHDGRSGARHIIWLATRAGAAGVSER